MRFGEREDEGPLLRAKAPVKIRNTRFAVGISASSEAGFNARASGSVPYTRSRMRWRLQSNTSLTQPRPVFALKTHASAGLPVAVRIAGEFGLSDLSARITLSAKPGVHSARPELQSDSSELAIRGHSACAAGTGAWAQARWEVAFSADSIIPPTPPSSHIPPADDRGADGSVSTAAHAISSPSGRTRHVSSGNRLVGARTPPLRVSQSNGEQLDRCVVGEGASPHTAVLPHTQAALPRISRAATSVAPVPWARARIVKLKFVKVPDRASARQVLCQECANAPLVRQQAPAVRGGLTLDGLAKAYASAKIEDAAPPLRALRRDLLTDLKAVTLAHWMLESDRGRSHLAWHHCNYARMRYRQDLAHLANPIRPPHAQVDYCSFDSAEDFIRAFWIALGREAFTQHTRALSLEPASSSDSACNAFLETLTLGGIVSKPDQVNELVPEARRLLAQSRS